MSVRYFCFYAWRFGGFFFFFGERDKGIDTDGGHSSPGVLWSVTHIKSYGNFCGSCFGLDFWIFGFFFWSINQSISQPVSQSFNLDI